MVHAQRAEEILRASIRDGRVRERLLGAPLTTAEPEPP